MSTIKKIGIQLFQIPLEEVLVDAKHGNHSFFELITVTIELKDGSEGTGYTYTGGKGGHAISAILEYDLAPFLIGQEAEQVEEIYDAMQWHVHYVARGGIASFAISAVDIALWDLAAKRADLSLATMLGNKRESITSYASLPCYESLSDYSDAVNEYSKLGHKIFKFHVWGSLDKDMTLIRLINKEFKGSIYRFMVDLESTYTFNDVITLGQLMDENLFIFIEAPIDDYLLEKYREIRELITIPIVPDGFELYTSEFIEQGIAKKSWDACKFDATTVGGITEAMKLMIIANNSDLPIELQSWGHSLVQLANLHLALANKSTQYFEVPMPRELYDFGMKDVILLNENKMYGPQKPGLGIEVKWSELMTADYYKKVSIGVK